ncbi:MAG: hypothetical protein ACE5IY_16420 [bacterium]
MTKQDLNRLLAFAIKNEASDVHLSAGSPPLLRVHGKLHRLESAHLSDTDVQRVFDQLLTERQKQTLETRREVDLPYVLPKIARFRTHVFYHLHGLAAAFRAIPTRVRTLEEGRPERAVPAVSVEKRKCAPHRAHRLRQIHHSGCHARSYQPGAARAA